MISCLESLIFPLSYSYPWTGYPTYFCDLLQASLQDAVTQHYMHAPWLSVFTKKDSLLMRTSSTYLPSAFCSSSFGWHCLPCLGHLHTHTHTVLACEALGMKNDDPGDQQECQTGQKRPMRKECSSGVNIFHKHSSPDLTLDKWGLGSSSQFFLIWHHFPNTSVTA